MGTEHYNFLIKARDALEIIPNIEEFIDEPVADASAVPTYLLAKHTRRFVTVALSGDGGDELLPATRLFQAFEAANVYKNTGILRKNFTDKLLRLIPDSEKILILVSRLKSLSLRWEIRKNTFTITGLEVFAEKKGGRLFRREVWGAIETNNEFEEIDNYWDSIFGRRN